MTTVVAEEVLSDARRLRNRLAVKPILVGMVGGVGSRFSGTDAYDFATEMFQLRGKLGRLQALALASVNDGDTLVDTKSDWQCRTLADSVASLDLGQSANS